MKRREFVEKLGIGSAGLVAGSALGTRVSASAAAQHSHTQVDGPLASATVSFGQWKTSPALDRFPNLNPRLANQHLLIPYMPTIKAGGSVNFIIAGMHLVAAYAPGTTIESINTSLIEGEIPGPPPTGFPGFINDPTNRIYRGLDPRALPQDRVEVVTFADPGTYLVICAFVPHFVVDKMHGFVKVVE